MSLKRFVIFILLLSTANLINCAKLENICEDETFIYYDYEVVNSIYRINFNRTHGPISNLLIDQSEEFDNMFNNQFHRYRVIDIRNLYNQVIREVFDEYLYNRIDESKLRPYESKIYEYLRRISDLSQMVKEDQKDRYMNITFNTISKGYHFIGDLVTSATFNTIGYNKDSTNKLKSIINSLSLEDGQKQILKNYDNTQILMFNGFDKMTGTINADLHIPINNANWTNDNNCLHLEQISKFYTTFWKYDPRNKDKFDK